LQLLQHSDVGKIPRLRRITSVEQQLLAIDKHLTREPLIDPG
jgi:hypothetical protein